MKKYFLYSIFICVLLNSCGSGSGGGGTSDISDSLSNVSYLDITDARSIYIGTNSNSQRVSGKVSDNSAILSRYNLFKINGNSAISKIKFLDKNKNSIESISQDAFSVFTPVFVSDVNDDFFVVGYSWLDPSFNIENENGVTVDPSVLFLVRKSDGTIYKLKYSGLFLDSSTKEDPHYFSPYNKQLFETDSSGSIYYINHGNEWVVREDFSGENPGDYYRVSKISALGNGKVSSTDITSKDNNIQCFEVDNSGNIVYSYYSSGMNFPKRIRRTSGSLTNLSVLTGVEDNYLNAIWKSFDGNIYYYTYSGIKKINFQSMLAENYGALDLGDPLSLGGCYGKYYTFNLNNCTYLIYSGGIAEVYNSTAILKKNAFEGLTVSYISHVCSTENYIYVAGRDTTSNYFLIRVTPDTGDNTKILWQDYEVLSFTASETDGIVFNALRILDGKKVLGKIPTNGVPGDETILRTEEDAEVYYLERIR